MEKNKVDNRINKALAEQKESNIDIDIMRQYRELIKAERIRTTVMIQNHTSRPQLLTSDSIVRFARSYAPVIVYNAEGRSYWTRWHDLYVSCFAGKEYNPGPFTHYLIVPKITLEDLIGDSKCEGCKYHNEHGDNICQLPACIKDNEGIQE